MIRTASEIRWGTDYENAIAFDPFPGDGTEPHVLDEVRTWRRPVPGSRRVRNNAGVTDAWIAARDYLLAGRARHFGNQGWGANGLQAFLDWAGEGNTFRFIPDRDNPSFYVGDCYLEDPFDDPQPQLEESDGRQSIDIVIRQQGTDFTQAVRGVMFEYVPGMSITEMGGTFARATTATYVDRNGVLRTAASGVLRDAHYINGFRHTLLEKASTNHLLWSNDFSNAVYAKSNMTVTTGISDPAGGTSACTLTATGVNAEAYQNRGNSTSVARTSSVWIRRRTGSGIVRILSPDAAFAFEVAVTTTWQRFSSSRPADVGRWGGVRLDTSGDAVDVWMCQTEDGPYATSEIPTTTATVTRNADGLYFAFLHLPQELAVLCRFANLGSSLETSFPGIWAITDAVGNGPSLYLYKSAAGAFGSHHTSSGDVEVTGAAVAFGDALDIRTVLQANGSILQGQSINDDAEALSGPSGALALATAWAGTRLWIGNRAPGTEGAVAIRSLRIMAGTQTMATIRAA